MVVGEHAISRFVLCATTCQLLNCRFLCKYQQGLYRLVREFLCRVFRNIIVGILDQCKSKELAPFARFILRDCFVAGRGVAFMLQL